MTQSIESQNRDHSGTTDQVRAKAAMSEDKRAELFEEYNAEIEKIKAEQPKGGRHPKLPKPVQQIGQVSKRDRSKNTDESRAKAAGTRGKKP